MAWRLAADWSVRFCVCRLQDYGRGPGSVGAASSVTLFRCAAGVLTVIGRERSVMPPDTNETYPLSNPDDTECAATDAYDTANPIEDTEIDPVLDQFESLTRTLLNVTTVTEALQQIVDATRLVVSGADLVSVTVLAPEGTYYTPAYTHQVAAELDQVQYRSGRGPCLDAASPDGPGYVVSDDLSVETRWPQFAAAACQYGYDTIISTELLPAAGPGQLCGALNIYSRRRHGLSRADRHAALLLATHGSLALAHAQVAELADLHRAQLLRAIDTRDIIGQAKGILMNRQGITADEAFDLLRRISQNLNIKLVDLARTLTTRHNELDQS